MVVLVQFRNRRDLGVGVTDVGQNRLDRLAAGFDGRAIEQLPLFDVQQLAQRGFRQDQGAEELDVGDRVGIAFLHAGIDVHRALVGGDAHLGRVNAEIGVTAIHVVRLQFFQIAGKLFARVLVVLGVPGHKTRRVRFETGAHFLVGKCVVADNVQFLDLGRFALADFDIDSDAIAFQLGNMRRYRDVVLAAVVILTDQFLLHIVQCQAVEGLTLGEADLLQPLLQVIGFDVLVAADRQLGNRRPLDHLDHHDVAFAIDFHVAEELGLIQRADGFLGLVIGQAVTLADGQIRVNRTRSDAAEAVDTNV